MQRANKRIEAWAKKNLTSNDINMYKKFIKNFNERLGIEGDEFNTNKWYTKEQQKEIRDIIKAMYANPDTNVKNWTDVYERIKDFKYDEDKDVNVDLFQRLDDMFNFQNEQDFINTVDNLNRWRSSALIREILSSEQYMDLSTYGSDAGLSQGEVDDMIIECYQKTGLLFESLYNIVFDAIQNYDKYDYFICMDQRNWGNMLRIFGTDKENKCCKLLDFTDFPRDVADPYWTGNFDETLFDVEQGVNALYEFLENKK